MRVAGVLFFLLLSLQVSAQKKQAYVSGLVIDVNDMPIADVSVTILGRTAGVITDSGGVFTIKVPAEKAFALLFTHTGYTQTQKNFYLSENEQEQVTIRLERSGKTLETVIITDERERKEAGLTKINPKNALALPSPTGGIEALIKILVGSNNELTSQYSVRGGNYDENLIYINDFEIFRPYLVRSGQQEGLSFINPELARNISFYNGGFQARYGDKMSSVLDIQYKKPRAFAGSAYMSLLEQGVHLEGATKSEKITYLFGARNRTNRNLLSSQETKGAYIPTSADVQGLITYKINDRWQVELLANISATRFTLIPEASKKTTSVFSPFFTANLGLDIYFEGQEKDSYNTSLFGISALYQPSKKLKLKWMLSRFSNTEKENFDIGGAYLFGNRDFDNNSSSFGQIVNPLGAGYYQDYGRNNLSIHVWNATLKGSVENGKHFIQFGQTFEQTNINDKLYEWEYQDSAGYSLPVNSNLLFNFLNSTANLSIQKLSGYVQDNMVFKNKNSDITLQGGLRYNYNSLNKELLVSPRAQVSIKPYWKKNIVFKMAAGLYQQPPFYRELRRYDGTLNTAIKAQKSFQVVAGLDYVVKNAGAPFRITTEAYYKNMWDVIAYDIDNVKMRYLGNNNAKAYAYGLETRLYGELVKDAESWLSIGLMRTKEDLANDFYYQYKNAAGEIINAGSADKTPVDSIRNDVGYVRRPTDRLVTVGLFLQDYLSTNKNFRVHLNMLYGSNMAFNIPQSVRYRNALIIEPYFRVDIGFSALLLADKNNRRSHSPFRSLENIWASFEIFNLIDRPNIISYELIKDFSNTVYSIPNRLTPRLINFKIVARF
ncbi:MAG TPA: carboxypeptidase-like regulatory domain-containing protein [Ferruginibacter sp.]|nr:carboxypeptidase-like regulatory domain-containing protein [Ferruginibacter sp.]HMP22023.1 carboxypeptidase-like regulatory domain-containing protein [Ferruginibacter sp.]